MREEVIYLACAVVDEADHGQSNGHLFVGGSEEGAVTSSFVAFEKDTADYGPNYWRVCASLAGAIDREKLAVGIEVVRDAENCF